MQNGTLEPPQNGEGEQPTELYAEHLQRIRKRYFRLVEALRDDNLSISEFERLSREFHSSLTDLKQLRLSIVQRNPA